ncbi:MAG: tRNA (adenosine(37)-N6)-dimethylallyltransferase MiaA [Pyrinomonadaceae bacterium]|nr:tRNA (adenosine(37)-N6)-dimethylallyltransferase MiaA [Pyrinomonadaceae bacterium]MCX7639117.1 tRNA (adenosine(37)-N6)-dimethylallyltransferase MiaA [Pyrinomonadaceae bacterium]MDW8303662.1 tRNA (adenosine(37)-N6)-dimethylallyltransferase MiaA [Acidobacteriota bacterium]
MKNPIYAIVGPTASGKTELSIELALRLKAAEIINCDSVQIYKGIQIATSKPTFEEMKGIPHHLFDYVDPNIAYTAVRWAKDASQKILEIEQRGNVPIIVGGTGFYLRTLMRPLFESPDTDQRIREKLKKIKQKKGPEHLHKILRKIDPEAARKLFPRDYPRVMRALEFFFQTGQRISEAQKHLPEPPEFAKRIKIFALNPPRNLLYEKINLRTEKHFTDGLVEEVRLLLLSGVKEDSLALGAHGYRRVCEYLRGEISLERAIEKTKQDVRNYAKRQITWFKKENVTWLEGFGTDPKIKEALWEIVKKDIFHRKSSFHISQEFDKT